MKKFLAAAALGAAIACGASAADFKVGVVNPAKILNESQPAQAAQNKLKSYFKTREDELNRLVRDFKNKASKFEKDAAVMSESTRMTQRRDLAEMERDTARRNRALVEERNQRAAEESQIILAKANRIIQDIAKRQKYDLILQEAVWASPSIDLTDEVIRQLNHAK